MIAGIKNIISIFKEKKGEIDRRHQHTVEEMRRKSSKEYYEELRPDLEKHYIREVSHLKASTLQAIENELAKVERRVNYMVTNINKENLAEIEAIRGMTISPYMEKVLIEKYAGDPWSTSKLMDVINEDRLEGEKLSFVHPEKFLEVAAQLKADLAFIIRNYVEWEEVPRPETTQAMIQIELAERNLDSYLDAFSCDYLIEPDFDAVLPLTDKEQQKIDSIFENCKLDHERKKAAKEAVDKGLGELISRSEYKDFLPDNYSPILPLSKEGERLIGGDISPSQYAGLEEIYEQGDLYNFSAVMAMGAEKAQTTEEEKNINSHETPKAEAE